ncbi:hypothetical protein [Streptomyces sp. ISL-94]|uniref:hypothetical protein n=1 Tax=Streptomyces sp. ISL-94 TaxID=2819190 RepID=UPI001BE69E3F|nr:hypothetical protein [Streptomyces sp. ISL-94]MBT2479874.1 hypothetical protein [Streptomyces sp. ISL-94]
MHTRSNEPTASTPEIRLRAPGDTLSARTLARAEHGLAAFIARWDDPEEIIHGGDGDGDGEGDAVAEGER